MKLWKEILLIKIFPKDEIITISEKYEITKKYNVDTKRKSKNYY